MIHFGLKQARLLAPKLQLHNMGKETRRSSEALGIRLLFFDPRHWRHSVGAEPSQSEGRCRTTGGDLHAPPGRAAAEVQRPTKNLRLCCLSNRHQNNIRRFLHWLTVDLAATVLRDARITRITVACHGTTVHSDARSGLC